MTLYEESRVEELKGQGAFVSFDVGFQNIMVFFYLKCMQMKSITGAVKSFHSFDYMYSEI